MQNQLRTAMIFAAGLGTRLKPITNSIPKALVPVGNKPISRRPIRRLKKMGINRIVINIHYLGSLIIDFLKQHQNFGIEIIISDETDLVLETGSRL